MTTTETALAWVNATGGLAGFSALWITVFRSRKRKYLPDDRLRDLLQGMHDDFAAIVANAGQPSLWFNEPERRRREMTLASLNGSVVDEDLNTLVGAARAEYLNCYSCSSPSRPANQVARQIVAAESGQTQASKAIERINFLSRKYGSL